MPLWKLLCLPTLRESLGTGGSFLRCRGAVFPTQGRYNVRLDNGQVVALKPVDSPYGFAHIALDPV